MYIGFASDVIAPNKITDYLIRVVTEAAGRRGRQTAEILGGKLFALRVWLDPEQARGLQPHGADVSAALAANTSLRRWVPPRARWSR